MKKTLGLKLLLITIVTSSLLVAIPMLTTSCGKTDPITDVVRSLDGKDWDGYAYDGSGFTEDDYQINNEAKTVTYQYNSDKSYSAHNLVIPNKILLNKVKYQLLIGDSAFSSTNLTGSITISDGIPSIWHYAFKNCSGITGSLVIPNSVTFIGNEAFHGCSGLTGSLTIPPLVTYIGDQAFVQTNLTRDENHILFSSDKKYCIGYINAGGNETKPSGSLTIPNTVTFIADSAFSYCSELTGSLTIPNSVTSIGNQAFAYCTSFSQSLIIPDSVTFLGQNTFYNCSGFTGTLTISNSLTYIAECAFDGCSGFTGSLTVPNSISSIKSYAFKNCSGFTGSLAIPNSVTSIDSYAFLSCSGLTGSLTIPSSVTFIGADSFNNTSFTRDENHTLYSSDKKWCIGYINAGNNENKPTGSLTFPSETTFICDDAFLGCSDLTGTLSFSSLLTSIGNGAFHNCSGFTGSLSFPSSLTSIGDGAFFGCSGLAGSLTIPSSTTSIGGRAFYNTNLTRDENHTLYSSDKKWCIGYINAGGSETQPSGTLTFPSETTYICDSAFSACSDLTGTLSFSSSVTSIGKEAFSYCDNITSIEFFPTTPPSFARSAFSGLDYTTDHPIYIPNGTTSIYETAFSNSGIPNSNWIISERN